MVHAFEVDGLYVALDVASGAVHRMDRLAYEAVKRYENKTHDEILSELKDDFGERAVREALDELKYLKESGELFSDESFEDAGESEPVIKAMCLHAAHDCNLRCRYCFAHTGTFNGPRGLLSEETGKAALDFLIANSGGRRNLEVDFFGGEPLLNFETVKALVAYGRGLESEHGKVFKFTVTTNGLDLTDEMIDFFNAEMSNVVISIDGRREVHDAMRPDRNGAGSYDKILPQALKLAESRGQTNYYVRGTFTAYNLDFADDVLSLYNAGFSQISVEPVVAPPNLPYAIRESDLPRIKREYERLARDVICRKKAGGNINFFHFMIDLSGGPCLKKRLSGCGVGNEYIAVTPEGDIYPCHQFVGRKGFRMGNVVTREFDKDVQAVFSDNNVLKKPACRECWARFYCSGGCLANAHQFCGSIKEPYQLECEMEKKRLECAIAIWIKEFHDM